MSDNYYNTRRGVIGAYDTDVFWKIKNTIMHFDGYDILSKVSLNSI